MLIVIWKGQFMWARDSGTIDEDVHVSPEEKNVRVLNEFKIRFELIFRQSSNMVNVFFDMSIGGQPVGRMVFKLYSDKLPRTCENCLLSNSFF